MLVTPFSGVVKQVNRTVAQGVRPVNLVAAVAKPVKLVTVPPDDLEESTGRTCWVK